MAARSIFGDWTHDGHVVKSDELTTVLRGTPLFKYFIKIHVKVSIDNIFIGTALKSRIAKIDHIIDLKKSFWTRNEKKNKKTKNFF